MTKLRRWLLDSSKPFSLLLAADARLRATDYTNDQVWRLSLGTGGGSPALVLQTSYGGRVGLASIIPMWFYDGRVIYETQAYSTPPVITGFAPGYLRAQAALTPQVSVQAEYWAIDSHTIGGQFTLVSSKTEAVPLRLDLFGHVGAQGKEQTLSVVPLENGEHALHFGKVGNINPALLLEGGKAEVVSGQPTIPKIGHIIPQIGRKKTVIRWVHAGLPTVQESIAQAQHWLSQDWTPHLRQIQRAASAIPDIETGDTDLDTAIASAFNELVLAYLKPTASLPHASPVARRDTNTGFSRQSDGSGHPRAWGGQTAMLSYLAALGVASIDPALAQGVVRNYLAIQQNDGTIDGKPGLGGQRLGLMCAPILARLAWGVYQFTEDDAFLREVLPGLIKFFERWLKFDVDGDGLPEWQHEIQTGYVYWPSFGGVQPWAENTDIEMVETPDLLAYLVSEAVSLQAIAGHLGESVQEQQIAQQAQKLQAALESLWDGKRYVYRDRDTHATAARQVVLHKGSGDQQHILALKLEIPARLNVRIEGGVDHTPRFKLEIAGVNLDGKPIREISDQTAFVWQHNRGVYTSRQVFAQVDLIRCEGLSRVYTIDAYTPDTTHLDINALLPLWSVSLLPERNAALINLLTEQFLRPNGVTMCAASDSHFDPSNANGSGGVWPFWLTLIAEGLIEAGRIDLATDVLQRLIRVQVAALREHKHFYEFYHSDEPKGLGTPGYLTGSLPVYLLLRVLGVRIISSGKVWTGGPYHWPTAISIRQHGVTVQRSAQGTHITFPSGYETSLPANAEWQAVVDTKPKAAAKPVRSRSSTPPDKA